MGDGLAGGGLAKIRRLAARGVIDLVVPGPPPLVRSPELASCRMS
jgi:hypothetical protein